MQEVILRDVDAIPAGGSLLRDYFWRKGEKGLAEQWHARCEERVTVLQGAQAERATVTTADTWLPHALEAGTLEKLVARLREIPALRRVYLVRKQVRYLPEYPLYIVGFRVTPWYRSRDEAAGEAVMAELKARVEWPGETFLLNIEIQPYALRSKFRHINGARIL
jgi:hypothetical protein